MHARTKKYNLLENLKTVLFDHKVRWNNSDVCEILTVSYNLLAFRCSYSKQTLVVKIVRSYLVDFLFVMVLEIVVSDLSTVSPFGLKCCAKTI